MVQNTQHKTILLTPKPISSNHFQQWHNDSFQPSFIQILVNIPQTIIRFSQNHTTTSRVATSFLEALHMPITPSMRNTHLKNRVYSHKNNPSFQSCLKHTIHNFMGFFSILKTSLHVHTTLMSG